MDYLGALKIAREAGIGEADFKLRWEEEKQERAMEREERAKEREREREEKDKEREFQLRKMELEMTMRERGMRDGGDNGKVYSRAIKLNPFDDSKEDLDSFLKRFERLSRANGFSVDTWADRLGALLSGKALDVYSGLSEEDSRDYEAVKKVLFKKYLLTAEGYRKKFRNTRLDRDETYTQLSVRLTRYFERWRELSESENTVEGLTDLLVREQMLRVVDPALAIYLKERDPKSLGEMVELADLYWDAHSNRRGQEQKVSKVDGGKARSHGDSGRLVCFSCGSPGHLSKQCDKHKPRKETVTPVKGNQGKSQREDGRGCYTCGSLDHIARFCRKRRDVTAAVLTSDEEDFQCQSPSSRINADPKHEHCRAYRAGTGDIEVHSCGESMKGFMTPEGPGYEQCDARNGKLAGVVNVAHLSGFEESTRGSDIPMRHHEQCEAHNCELAGDSEAHLSGFEESKKGSDIPMRSYVHCETYHNELAGGSEAHLGGFKESTGGPDIPINSCGQSEAYGGALAGGREAHLSGAVESVKGSDIPENCFTAPFLEIGKIGGEEVSVLRDTGCTTAIIKRSKLPPNSLTGRQKTYILMDGTVRSAPVAEVWVETPFYTGLVRALAVENPVADVIIGNIEGASIEQVSTVLTRFQKRERDREEGENVNENDDARERRGQEVSGDCQLGKLTPAEIAKAQNDDETLKPLRERATVSDQQSDKYKVSIIKREGMYFRVKKGLEGRADTEQLLVPRRYRNDIMKIAHEGMFGGHLGIARTQDRIMQSFFWPGIGADVARFCRSCDACQRTEGKGRVPKVPLVPTPLIDAPFSRVAVDLVGPLPMTEKGRSRYVLTLVDYATRFPDAVALKGISAEQVAEGLFEIFSRLGFPKEIVSDRGSQFTGELMRGVSGLLQTKQIFCSPYHAMANGLCERFNGVLKTMLRRVAHDKPKEWDRFLHPLLFAYRETPQASTGFSPFELVFGHPVRGPLSILKDLWTGEADGATRSSYEYVLDMRDRLQQAMTIVTDNLSAEQVRQKKYYDRSAKQRKFEMGDSVLILLPSETSKLQMTWKGPYKVIEQTSGVNYLISVGGKRKLYHVNMLKKYVEREDDESVSETVAAAIVEDREGDGEAPMSLEGAMPQLEQTETYKDVSVGENIEESQRKEMIDLITEYQDIFSDLPGRTDMIEHKIEVLDKKPVKVKPYNLPFSTREAIKGEVDKMLRAGIIEPSESPYSCPIVLVKKPDGQHRFCNDYRRLNVVTADDAEPMPQIEMIMANLAEAKYYTKLDLTKGFYQVPMAEDSKPMTAFATPFGLFQYRVMPFGLKNSPATFNRLMRKVLKGIDQGVEVFIDDCLIHSKTWPEHIERCRQVFERLRQANLKARPTKTVAAMNEVEYLGHRVGTGTIRPQEDKVRSIVNSERPATKKQVRSFLGLTGYYRKFVPNYSAISAPLSDLTKKSQGKRFQWGVAQEHAFTSLKKLLSSEPILIMPDWKKEMILQTDASNAGISGCLLQERDGVRHPILYTSRKLKPAETKYSTIEKECLAIVFALGKLQHYLYGRNFILETDHRPLTWMRTKEHQNARVTRWNLALQAYNFRIHNIKGRDALWADALSRLPEED